MDSESDATLAACIFLGNRFHCSPALPALQFSRWKQFMTGSVELSGMPTSMMWPICVSYESTTLPRFGASGAQTHRSPLVFNNIAVYQRGLKSRSLVFHVASTLFRNNYHITKVNHRIASRLKENGS
jgi:hypothetical protein